MSAQYFRRLGLASGFYVMSVVCIVAIISVTRASYTRGFEAGKKTALAYWNAQQSAAKKEPLCTH